MSDVSVLFDSLKTAATSPLAMVGYLAAIGAWVVVGLNGNRLNKLTKALGQLPEADRLRALELEYKAFPKSGLTPKDFLKLKRQQFRLAAFIITLLAILALVSFAAYVATRHDKAASLLKTMELVLKTTRIGQTAARENDFAEAVADLRQAVQTYPTAQGYANLAYVDEELSRTDEAIDAYQQAIALDRRPEYLNNLGALYMDKGQMSLAETTLTEALSRVGSGSELDALRFIVLGSLGNLDYERANAAESAEERVALAKRALTQWYLPALKLRGSSTDNGKLAAMLTNVGSAYVLTGDMVAADTFLNEALVMKRKMSASRPLGYTLLNLGDARTKAGDLRGARAALAEAQGIFELCDHPLGLGVAHVGLGDLDIEECHLDQAMTHYSNAVAAFAKGRIENHYSAVARERSKSAALPKHCLPG